MLVRIVIPSPKLFTRLWRTLLTIVVRFIATVTDAVLLEQLIINQAKAFLGNLTDVITVTDNIGVDVLALLPKDSLPTRWLYPKLGVTQINPMSVTV
jgi:hypothetical protein